MRILEKAVNFISAFRLSFAFWRGRGRKATQFSDPTPLAPEADLVLPPPRTPLEAFERLGELRAIHNLIALATNRLSWSVETSDASLAYHPDPLLTRRLEFSAGLLAADYLMFSECYVTDKLQRIHPATGGVSGVVRIARYPELGGASSIAASPLASASWLVRKLWELNRAETQLLTTMGAGAFLTPSDAAMPLTADELESLRQLIRDKTRRAGVGGLEPLSAAIDIKPIPIDVQKYQLIALRTQLVRELCNLFSIDSSLLNDPDNKTYSNKDLALKAFFTNVIIPIAYELKYRLELAFSIRITIDHSNIEVLHTDKRAQADYIVSLLAAGIITRDEARNMLELE